MKRFVGVFASFCLLPVFCQAQEVIPLYSGTIPNSKKTPNEQYSTAHAVVDSLTYKVSVPTLSVFFSSKEKANGTAVIICPGGGYHVLLTKREGTDVAKEFNKLGVTAFVLKYRLPDDKVLIDKAMGPLQDAQQAIRLVRERAGEWNIDPSKIGIMGFSAGGHLAATAGTHFADSQIGPVKTSLRPDFMILINPVISFTDAIGHIGSRDNLLGKFPSSERIDLFSNELQITPQTPPTYLVHSGADEVVPVANSVEFYKALIKNGVSGELHVYSKGEHGFLTYPSFREWFDRVAGWMRSGEHSFTVLAQKNPYIDGRPYTANRIACKDEGIVMRYGDGKDSCDTYGAREAVVNKEGDTYYLFYDGAGKDGWISCLAESKDLKSWIKKGTILTLGDAGKNDSKSASSPWVIKDKGMWHMFYVGTPNTTPPPYRIPAFPYLTLKAKSKSLTGPWIKQYDVIPLPPTSDSYYSVTSSPGDIVKHKGEFIQFFSGATQDVHGVRRTLGIARTRDLDKSWNIEPEPIFPLTEQVENSSVFFDEKTKTWFLFTNHIGINSKNEEYTDAIWVYWTKDVNKWNADHKAVVIDGSNRIGGTGAIGMPTVIRVGNKLAMLYDATEGSSTSHMHRSINLAWMDLPLQLPQ